MNAFVFPDPTGPMSPTVGWVDAMKAAATGPGGT
jgi:hypothetical protein